MDIIFYLVAVQATCSVKRNPGQTTQTAESLDAKPDGIAGLTARLKGEDLPRSLALVTGSQDFAVLTSKFVVGVGVVTLISCPELAIDSF